MATYSYTPSVGEVGDPPDGFTWAGGSGTTAAYTVVDAGSGRYAVRFTGGDFAATQALAWDGNGNPPAFADGEVYMRLRLRSDTGNEIGLFLRAAGANPNWTSGTFTAYWNRVRANGTSALCRYREYDSGGVASEIDSASPAWGTLTSAIDVDLHLMLKCDGTTISFKAWKEGDTEPGYSTTTDSTNSTASLLRLHFSNTQDTDVYFIGVGTGGDAAPRGGAPGGGGSIAPILNNYRRRRA